MAATQQKRQREEEEKVELNTPLDEFDDEPNSKRRNSSYNSILSILDDEQENTDSNPNQDLSAIFTTLEQELSTSTPTPTTTATTSAAAATFEFDDYLPSTTTGVEDQDSRGGEEDSCVRVMKHLLEASDDELGIPNRVDGEINPGENPPPFGFSGGLWELEDETANYYTILQSELFM